MLLKRVLPIVCILAASAAWAGKGPVPTTTTKIKTDPTLFLGLSWTFGAGAAVSSEGSPGLTLKVLSTNKRHAGAAAAGVTYNFDGTFGCDLGLGYNMDGAALTASWDFCRSAPQMAVGGIKKPKKVTRTVTPAPPGAAG